MIGYLVTGYLQILGSFLNKCRYKKEDTKNLKSDI